MDPVPAQVVIIIPVLRRPYRAAPVAASAAAATPEGRVLFVVSADDEIEWRACEATGADVLTVGWAGGAPGDWARKVNAAYRATSEPWMLLGADDLVFWPGWFTAAMDCCWGDPKVGVIGTNDTASPRVKTGHHSTHPLVSRSYADERGTLQWEDETGWRGGAGHVVVECYSHNFVDDELVGTAKARRAWRWVQDAVVEHHHPSWGTAPDDEVYQLGRAGWDRDRALHSRRARLWRDGRRAR